MEQYYAQSLKVDLSKKNLREVEELLQNKEISEAEADEYIAKWNTGTFRFTHAEREGNRIYNESKCLFRKY